MRTVSEILLQKGPHFNFIESEATVIDAIGRMKTENISYLIVLENGKYTGVVSERDYARKVILANKHSDTTLVKEIMTTDLPIISYTDSAEHCMLLMNASKSRYLPVFADAVFKGVITMHDLFRETINDNLRIIEGMQSENAQQHYWI